MITGDSSVNINVFGEYIDGVDDIAQSWYIILHTIPGSDPLRPNFGSDIYKYVDKPLSGFSGSFQAQIIKDLEKWETRCTISQVSVKKQLDNSIKIIILGVFTETNKKIEATFNIGDLPSVDITSKMQSYSNDYNAKEYS